MGRRSGDMERSELGSIAGIGRYGTKVRPGTIGSDRGDDVLLAALEIVEGYPARSEQVLSRRGDWHPAIDNRDRKEIGKSASGREGTRWERRSCVELRWRRGRRRVDNWERWRDGAMRRRCAEGRSSVEGNGRRGADVRDALRSGVKGARRAPRAVKEARDPPGRSGRNSRVSASAHPARWGQRAEEAAGPGQQH